MTTWSTARRLLAAVALVVLTRRRRRLARRERRPSERDSRRATREWSRAADGVQDAGQEVERACTIGFQNPIAANEFLGFLQKAVVAEGKRYGCRVITLDDALSPDKQVTNMQQLLAQNVGVIIFYPLDPKATTPVLQQAQTRGRAGDRDRRELRRARRRCR